MGEVLVYHEKQVAGLCGVHCLNTLLQGPYFSEIDLMKIAHELDSKEREFMAEAGTETKDYLKFMAEDSGNVADDGNFSIEVLAQALKVWGLTPIPLTNPEAGDARTNPTAQNAFICHLEDHWFTIRKVDGYWWNFDSLQNEPSYVGDFYLSLFLDTLTLQGYTIFTVKGTLPESRNLQGMDNDKGKWLYVSPNKRAAASRAATEEDEIAAAIRLSLGAQTNNQQNTAPILHPSGYDEDAELAAAIAASLEQT